MLALFRPRAYLVLRTIAEKGRRGKVAWWVFLHVVVAASNG